MAQNITTKQQNFVSNFTTAVVALLTANDNLVSLCGQWNANAYATGASPTSNNITDALLNGQTPPGTFQYLTAAELNSAEGAVAAVQATVAAQRGYLEAVRP